MLSTTDTNTNLGSHDHYNKLLSHSAGLHRVSHHALGQDLYKPVSESGILCHSVDLDRSRNLTMGSSYHPLFGNFFFLKMFL